MSISRLVQDLNADEPMLLRLLGRDMLTILVQLANAELPIFSPPVIVTFFKDAGTELVLLEDVLAPNMYPKLVLPVPSCF